MLAPAYPQPLNSKLPSKFGFYCWRGDGGFCFHNFHAAYAAKWFLDYLLDDAEFKWIDDATIITQNGFKIRGERDTLELIIDYIPTREEREWEPPSPYIDEYAVFAGRKKKVELPNEPTPKPRKERPKVAEEIKVSRRKEKIKTGDYITVGQICEELGHHPRECRAILRALNVPKPAHGWAWPPAEAAEIKKRLAKKLA